MRFTGIIEKRWIQKLAVNPFVHFYGSLNLHSIANASISPILLIFCSPLALFFIGNVSYNIYTYIEMILLSHLNVCHSKNQIFTNKSWNKSNKLLVTSKFEFKYLDVKLILDAISNRFFYKFLCWIFAKHSKRNKMKIKW